MNALHFFFESSFSSHDSSVFDRGLLRIRKVRNSSFYRNEVGVATLLCSATLLALTTNALHFFRVMTRPYSTEGYSEYGRFVTHRFTFSCKSILTSWYTPYIFFESSFSSRDSSVFDRGLLRIRKVRNSTTKTHGKVSTKIPIG